MKKFKLVILVVLLIGFWGNILCADSKKSVAKVQMAILLDTSGSMQGLIEQAKTQLWRMINEMASAEKHGQIPRLEVALYEYGKNSIPASEGYLRMIVPLSTDLDKISEELFKLRTNGGSEYCGKVIQASIEDLKWSPRNSDYKVIFIAGNEPFTQGNLDYRSACKNAVHKRIIVNTIFCGSYREGINTQWKDGADRSDGQYLNINHNRKIVHIAAPQDREIIQLGNMLNKTYIAFGDKGKQMKDRQTKQDANAQSLNSAVMAERSITKASKQYRNETWDLVDAEKEGKIIVAKMKTEELPPEMQKLDQKGRKKYIEDMRKKRAGIQKKIGQLKMERDKYISKKRKELKADDTLDEVMISTIKAQAGKKNFKFKTK